MPCRDGPPADLIGSETLFPRPAASTAGFFAGTALMELDFTKLDGLLPAVIQDHVSRRVLMLGFMNEEAWRKTVETGFATFYSRSRNKLWTKGESSGHRLVVKSIQTDCDRDSLVILVEALGPGVCHNGYRSCFYRTLDGGAWKESEAPAFDPNAVYGGSQ
jgi:phosphoribosyl-AMP cyclohydrolase